MPFDFSSNGEGGKADAMKLYIELVLCHRYHRTARADFTVEHPASAAGIDEINATSLNIKLLVAVADGNQGRSHQFRQLKKSTNWSSRKKKLIRIGWAAVIHGQIRRSISVLLGEGYLDVP